MKPPRFEYYDPRTVEEALKLFTDQPGESKVLSGGQSLMPLLNMRLLRPKAIIDINRIESLKTVRPWNQGLSVGAGVAVLAIETDRQFAERLPILYDAARHIAHPQIRNRGTAAPDCDKEDPGPGCERNRRVELVIYPDQIGQ